MNTGNEYRAQLIAEYTEKISPLFRYIPYLKEKEGSNISSLYKDGNKLSNTVPVPVYDSTVLSFVKEAQKTGYMDRNYIYTYNLTGAKNAQDERLYISDAKLVDVDKIIAIIAKYVLGGMIKGRMWTEAVESGVWLHALLKIKEVLEVVEGPLA